MAAFLVECREDKDKLIVVEEASSPIFETTASFTNGAILTEI